MAGIDIQFVYFVQAKTGGPIKIGTTNDLDARLAELQCGNHQTLRYIGTVEGDQALERQLHAELRHHRIRGEWFTPVQAVKEAMDRVGARSVRRDRVLNRPLTCQCPPCTNCGLNLGTMGKNGMCRACQEFARLRESGHDPFETAA